MTHLLFYYFIFISHMVAEQSEHDFYECATLHVYVRLSMHR